MKTNIRCPTGLITKCSTQSLNIHTAMHMYVRVYLLHAYKHGLRKFRQGVGSMPNVFQDGPMLFHGRGRMSNCYILYINLWIFQGERYGPPPPLYLRKTFIHVSLYKAFKSHKNVAGSMFSKGTFENIMSQKSFFIAFVLGSTYRNH